MERPFNIKAFIRLMVRMIIRFAMFGCLLFIPAGTIAWPQGWGDAWYHVRVSRAVVHGAFV